MSKRLPVPRPVSINEVCSECGELWVLHPERATLLDCVRLLKAKTSTTIVTNPCVCPCHSHAMSPWNPIPFRPYPIWVSSGTSTSDPFAPLQLIAGGTA